MNCSDKLLLLYRYENIVKDHMNDGNEWVVIDKRYLGELSEPC